MDMMIDAATAPCTCGSGLPASKCCRLDTGPLVAVLVCPEPVAMAVREAVALFQDRRRGEAAATCLAVLGDEPLLAPALHLLADIRKAEGVVTAELALRRRLHLAQPRDLPQLVRFVTALVEHGDKNEAVLFARRGVWMQPEDPRANWLMALAFAQTFNPAEASYHFERAMAATESPNADLMVAYADHLMRHGQMETARTILRDVAATGADTLGTMVLQAMLEEHDNRLDEAEALLARAAERFPWHPALLTPRATVAMRRRDFAGALAILDGAPDPVRTRPAPAMRLLRGRILGELGRYDESFAEFVAAKAALRETARIEFRPEQGDRLIAEVRRVFTPLMMRRLPRAKQRTDVPQPIFITGFQRSGTTMVEQSLSMHPRIAAAGELNALSKMMGKIRGFLNSNLPYPGALQELFVADRRHGLEMLRDDYLNTALPNMVEKPGAVWFTDKALQQEAHIPLIALAFPASPVFNVVRHPLDSVLSVLSLMLPDTGGYSMSLESAAHAYRQNAEAAAQWRLTLPDLRLLTVRYEDILADQEAEVRRMLDFVGEPYDPACLDFHENTRVPATLSYAQVRSKINTERRYRYKPYVKHLAPAIAILEPVIEALGYTVEG